MTPILYILMRSDMDSMNPGKAMAQASHSSNAFIHKFGKEKEVEIWKNMTPQGFGTVIVLDIGNEQTLLDLIIQAGQVRLAAEVIHDPTYPIQDGEVVHYLPINTCGYIFGDKNNFELQQILKDFPLHE